ncbi:MAG: hypothetical protein OQL09_03530 [Gammaproteobacteria bacterium]|nr:hypothetical protein [Gammaproteobacteria bacterium]
MKKLMFFILMLAGLSLSSIGYAADPDSQQDRLMDRLQDRDDDYEQDRDRDRDRDQFMEQDDDGDKNQLRDQERTQVYGWQLMTPEERIQHRNKMRSMKTQQEREQYLMEHHKRMQERAEEQGVSLPDFQSQRVPGGRGRYQTQ